MESLFDYEIDTIIRKYRLQKILIKHGSPADKLLNLLIETYWNRYILRFLM